MVKPKREVSYNANLNLIADSYRIHKLSKQITNNIQQFKKVYGFISPNNKPREA